MKVKIDFKTEKISINGVNVKPKFKPTKPILKKLAKEITNTIKHYVFENRLQVRKETHSFKKFNAIDKKNGEIIEYPYKTVIKAGLWAEKPEVISIYNYKHGYNVFIINEPKLQKLIENVLVKNLS